jgi:hypothetical protein
MQMCQSESSIYLCVLLCDSVFAAEYMNMRTPERSVCVYLISVCIYFTVPYIQISIN